MRLISTTLGLNWYSALRKDSLPQLQFHSHVQLVQQATLMLQQMPKTLLLLRGDITLSAAKYKEINIIHALGYVPRKHRIFDYLYENRESIQAVVPRHLDLSDSETCHLDDPEE